MTDRPNLPGDDDDGVEEPLDEKLYRRKPPPTPWKQIIAFLLILVCTGGLAGLGAVIIYFRMERQTRNAIHSVVEEVPKRDVALVLGASVRGIRLSAMLEDRVNRAVDLYNAGKVGKLLMSGDNSSEYYDEATAMRRHAIKLGVPPDDVVCDFAGFRTFDSIVRARELWGVDSMVIVTQAFHLPRSIYLARRLGVDAHGLVADSRRYQRASLRKATTREIAARIGAWLDVNILGTQPHFLGRRESLSGLEQEAEQRGITKEALIKRNAEKETTGGL